MKESTARRIYREKCKHFLPMSEMCCMKSDKSNGWHWSIGCDGKCPRMKRYDKKQAKTKIAGDVILENGEKLK